MSEDNKLEYRSGIYMHQTVYTEKAGSEYTTIKVEMQRLIGPKTCLEDSPNNSTYLY